MTLPSLFDLLPHKEALAIYKLASGEKKDSAGKQFLHAASGTLLGTLAGAGAAHLADKAYGRLVNPPPGMRRGIPVPYLELAAPVIGGAASLAYTMAQAKQNQEER